MLIFFYLLLFYGSTHHQNFQYNPQTFSPKHNTLMGPEDHNRDYNNVPDPEQERNEKFDGCQAIEKTVQDYQQCTAKCTQDLNEALTLNK